MSTKRHRHVKDILTGCLVLLLLLLNGCGLNPFEDKEKRGSPNVEMEVSVKGWSSETSVTDSTTVRIVPGWDITYFFAGGTTRRDENATVRLNGERVEYRDNSWFRVTGLPLAIGDTLHVDVTFSDEYDHEQVTLAVPLFDPRLPDVPELIPAGSTLELVMPSYDSYTEWRTTVHGDGREKILDESGYAPDTLRVVVGSSLTWLDVHHSAWLYQDNEGTGGFVMLSETWDTAVVVDQP